MIRHSPRNAQLGRIHQAQKALGLDDATYRALLARVTGKHSCAEMSSVERNAVLAEFGRLGFKAEQTAARKRAYAGRPHGELSPMLRKVSALLTTARRPWAYAHGMAKRMFDRPRIEWLRDDELHRLIAALELDARRRAARKERA